MRWLMLMVLCGFAGCGGAEEKPAPPDRGDSSDDGNNDDGNTDDATCSGSDEDECWDAGYSDAYYGYSPDPAYWVCEGDCEDAYCEGYCLGELDTFGDYYECEYCG